MFQVPLPSFFALFVLVRPEELLFATPPTLFGQMAAHGHEWNGLQIERGETRERGLRRMRPSVRMIAQNARPESASKLSVTTCY